MGTVSAIPENLYRYADTCTKGAEQLQTWVRAVLEPAVGAYRNGGGTCFVIDGQVAQQVAAAYYADRDVKVVGLAFAQAGGVLVRRPGDPIRVNDKTVTATFQKLQLQAVHQAQIRAGAELAKKMKDAISAKEYAAIIKELNQHGKDPYLVSGFYNNLNAQKIESALAFGGIPALVNAYSVGALDKGVTDTITKLLTLRDTLDLPRSALPADLGYLQLPDERRPELLNALAANPKAARLFAESLSRQGLRDIFYGALKDVPAFRPALLKILTVGLSQQPDAQQAQALMHKITVGLFGGDSPVMKRAEWGDLMEPLAGLYWVGVAKMGTDAPKAGASPRELQDWMKAKGTQIGSELAPLLAAANNAAPNQKALKQFLKVGFTSGLPKLAMLIPASLPLAAGIKVGSSIAVPMLMAAAQYGFPDNPLNKRISSLFDDGDAPDATKVNTQLTTGGFSMMVSALVAQNRVHHRVGSTDRFVSFGNDPAVNSKLLLDILSKPHDYKIGEGHGIDDPPTIHSLLQSFENSERKKAMDGLMSGYKKPKE